MAPEGDPFDILVVGGGPVGLHAALKAAVLNHRVLLVDRGMAYSRVSQAPSIANIPGRPGVSGPDLLRMGREDIRAFEALGGKELVTLLEETEAVTARRDGDVFVVGLRGARGAEREARARVLVLATGTVDRKPGIGDFWRRGHATLAPYVHRGGVGYCILCEGWALDGERVAVVGARRESAQVALDLHQQFAAEVVLVTDGVPLAEDVDRVHLDRAGVRVDERPVEDVGEDEAGHVRLRFTDGGAESFGKVFFSLGWYRVNNLLACELGAKVNEDGYVVTNTNCEVLDADGNVIEGLFAVGDLRAGGWKQIVVGWGDAETAVITAYAFRLPPAAVDRGEVAAPAR